MSRQDTEGSQESSEFIEHIPCEKCGSSDANSLYTDGHQFCFACDHWVPGEGSSGAPRSHKPRAEGTLSMRDHDGIYTDLTKRGITVETCRKFGYWVGKLHGQTVQVADYRDSSGALVGQKIRDRDKNFTAKGDVSRDLLWGRHLWAGKGKMIVVTEGEIDCLTVSQLQGNKWPTVSVPCGAKAAAKSLAANYDYLDGFEKIILMFDMDEPGREAVKEAAQMLPPGKVHVAHLPMKDANECLLAGNSEEVTKAIWNAAPYRPDGIVSARDLIERALNVAEVESIPFPIGQVLNDRTRGLRGGEVIMLTSGSGMGKSSFARQTAFELGHVGGRKIGLAFIEESPEETLLDMTGLKLKKRIRQFPEKTNPEEKRKAMFEVFDNDTFHLYDHFGSTEEDSLVNKLRYMRTVLDCEVVVLDHISIVVSGMDGEGDERKTIDRLMTKLKTMAKATGVALIVITHLKRKDGKGKSHEEGATISLSELRGSGAIAQLSDTVIGFERDQQGDRPNIILIRILKCRFTGDTGVAGYLAYNKETGLLEEYIPAGDEDEFPPDPPEGQGDY